MPPMSSDPTPVGAWGPPSNETPATVGDLAGEIREWLEQAIYHEESCPQEFAEGYADPKDAICQCYRHPAVRALRAVMELHVAELVKIGSRPLGWYCHDCAEDWPCSTVRAIHAELIGGEGRG